MVSLTLEYPTELESFSTPVPVRLFSVEEYQLMARAGILHEDHNVELLGGWISPKMTQNPPHSVTVSLLLKSLLRRIPAESYHVRVQMSISTNDSEPEPDLVIVRGLEEVYLDGHPRPDDIGLVVEVADNSLSRDRFKAKIYARAGVQEYWLVNLIDRCVELYRSPISTEIPRYQEAYRVAKDETIETEIFDGIKLVVPVDEFLKLR